MHSLLLVFALAAPRPVDLTEALKLAAAQNPALAAARADAAVLQATVRRASSAWQPELIASGSFDHTSAPQFLNYGQFAGLVGGVYGLTPKNPGAIPAPLALQAPNSTYATLTLSQPFFSPQGLFGLQPAESAASAAALGAEATREQVLLGVARAYLGVLGLEDLSRAAADAEAVSRRREADAQARLDAGSGTPIALLRAQGDTLRAHSQLEALRAQREETLALLTAAAGEEIAPRNGGPIAFPVASAEAAEPWRRTFNVLAAARALAAIEASLRLDHFLWLPTVGGLARGSYNSNAGFAGTTTSWDVGVAITIPLYDRGLRYAAAAEDESRLLAARARLRDATAQARATWIGARANDEAAGALLAGAEAQAKVASQAQRQVEVASRSGAATNLELSEADAQRFFADSTAAQARAALNVRRAEVAAAEGQLYRSLEP